MSGPGVGEVTAEQGETAVRWRPTRAGILNVWRYYQEVFTFHRGRLLLRGRNGTGKSKALELLLPFLLDASLRPNRLSTFGGNERAMHWNMIGHGYQEQVGAAQRRLRSLRTELSSVHAQQLARERERWELRVTARTLQAESAAAVESRDRAAERFCTKTQGRRYRFPTGPRCAARWRRPVRCRGRPIARTTPPSRSTQPAGRSPKRPMRLVRPWPGAPTWNWSPRGKYSRSVRCWTVRGWARGLYDALVQEQRTREGDLTEEERALFERVLTGDTRRHPADRLRRANGLVEEMNERLERVRTASGVTVRLRRDVASDAPNGTQAARDLLTRDPRRLTDAQHEVLHRFFRERIDDARAEGSASGREEHLGRVLDYTAWHSFTVELDKGDGAGRQPLTRRAHGRLSGGEKAIALHLPLFAAMAAHYATDPGSPRFILLDEVFVGMDTANRGQIFGLLVDLGLDLVLTSDHEWGTYAELDGIAVHPLVPGEPHEEDDAVTTARFSHTGGSVECSPGPVVGP